MARSKMKLVLLASVGAMAFADVSTAVHAFTIDEIVVTSRAREETVQDVSIAIDVTPGEVLMEQNIIDVKAFGDRTPSMVVSESPFQPIVNIRGLGSGGGNRLYEQSAPFFVDGLFAGRAQQFLTPFFDLSRVEVIKGPQAVFFGKNATAGAVSMHAARPTEELEGLAHAAYEIENDGYVAEGMISGALSNTLRGRLAARTSRQGPYLNDLTAGNKVPDIKDYAVRGSLEWDATDSLEVYLKLEYSERDMDGRKEQLICGNPAFTMLEFPPGSGTVVECVEDTNLTSGSIGPFAGPFAITDAPGTDKQDNENLNAVLKAEWSLDNGHILEFTTTYSGYDTEDKVSADFSGLPVTTSQNAEDFNQWTQEIRLLSPTDQTLEYVFGAFVMHQDHKNDNNVSQGVPAALTGLLGVPPAAPFLGDAMFIEQEAFAWSLFGQLTYNITEDFRLIAGGRFTRDEKDYNADVYRIVGLPGGLLTMDTFDPMTAATMVNYDLERNESNFAPSATIEWNASDDILAYATFAIGSKAGGFEHFPRALVGFPVPAANLEFEDEKATNYEIGLKTTFLDGAARLNLAAFWTDYEDLQIQLFDGPAVGFQTLNAEESRIRGLEADGVFVVNEFLSIGGAVTYLDAEHISFTNTLVAPTEDLSGDTFVDAPKWSGNLYASASMPISNGHALRARVQMNYKGDRIQTERNDPADLAESYTTFDARVSFGADDGTWEFYVNALNVFDKDDIKVYGNEHALTSATNFPGGPNARFAIVAPGRTVFLGGLYRF